MPTAKKPLKPPTALQADDLHPIIVGVVPGSPADHARVKAAQKPARDKAICISPGCNIPVRVNLKGGSFAYSRCPAHYESEYIAPRKARLAALKTTASPKAAKGHAKDLTPKASKTVLVAVKDADGKVLASVPASMLKAAGPKRRLPTTKAGFVATALDILEGGKVAAGPRKVDA